MIYTSNFSFSGREPNAVSIAGKTPDWFRGRRFPKLAPRKFFFDVWKQNGDNLWYIEQYKKHVLDMLDPGIVYAELNDSLDGAILLCYETPGEFCHRRLVAEWFERTLGVKVPEIPQLKV